MKKIGWKFSLALLGGAVVLGLAIGALVFRGDDSGTVVKSDASSGPNDAGGADSSEPKSLILTQKNSTVPAKVEALLDSDPRLNRILNKLQSEYRDVITPEIFELLRLSAYLKLTHKKYAGRYDESDIYGTLSFSLDILRETNDSTERNSYIQRWKNTILVYLELPYDPRFSEKNNRVRQYLFELYGEMRYPERGETPREVIDILVEGMDDLTAAKYLFGSGEEWSAFPDAPSIKGDWSEERGYALEYAEKVLASDPTSSDALHLKILMGVDQEESARLLLKHHSHDHKWLMEGVGRLRNYPEEVIAALEPVLPADGLHPDPEVHRRLGWAYESLDMLQDASDQYLTVFANADPETHPYTFQIGRYRYALMEHALEQRSENSASIWEKRAAESGEALKETPPPPPEPSEEPPHPPADAERDLADAYAQFAEAYRSAFEAEYGPPADTPEGRMNALLGMARAFAKAGDAEQAQAAYNEARKRYTREQVQEAFRRLDEAERLRRQQGEEQEGEQE